MTSILTVLVFRLLIRHPGIRKLSFGPARVDRLWMRRLGTKPSKAAIKFLRKTAEDILELFVSAKARDIAQFVSMALAKLAFVLIHYQTY